MTVTDVRADPQSLTLQLDAEFTASPARVWGLWADPRLLERWWGPPTYPATVTFHDLRPGGRVAYHLTGPEGDEIHAYWDVVEVDEPRTLSVRDGFAHPDGTPNDDLATNRMRTDLRDLGDGRTRMSVTTTFADVESMEQLLARGMADGIREAVGQVDAILAELPSTSDPA